MKNEKLFEGVDPMLLPISELEKYAEHDEFLRGVYFARLSYKVAGVSCENKED